MRGVGKPWRRDGWRRGGRGGGWCGVEMERGGDRWCKEKKARGGCVMEKATTPSLPLLPGGLLPFFPPLLSRAWTKWRKRLGDKEGKERRERGKGGKESENGRSKKDR